MIVLMRTRIEKMANVRLRHPECNAAERVKSVRLSSVILYSEVGDEEHHGVDGAISENGLSSV